MTAAMHATRVEVGRKAIHLAMFVFPVWIAWAPDAWRTRGLLFALLIVLTADVLRLRWSWFRARVHERVGSYLREHEQRGLTSVHYLTLAALVLGVWLPPRVAAAALGFLVLGDALAALVGERWGRPRWGHKSLEGSLACFAGCMMAGALFLPYEMAAVSAAAALVTVVEALPIRVNDNLSVPFAAAAILWLLI